MKIYATITLGIIMISTSVPCFALLPEDSIWVHIVSLIEKQESKKWKAVEMAWELFVKEFDDSSKAFGDWRQSMECDSLSKIFFAVECANDSLFAEIAISETANAQSYVISGIPVKQEYFVRIVPMNFANPYRSGFAVGGIIAHDKTWLFGGRQKERHIIIAASILAVLIGIGILGYQAAKNRKGKILVSNNLTEGVKNENKQ